MSGAFLPLSSRSGPLSALTRQGRSVRRFAVMEEEAREMILPFSEPLPPMISQSGGLLNEQILEPFFSNPLPDTAVAVALETSPEPGPPAPIDESHSSGKMKMDGAPDTLKSAAAQALQDTRTEKWKPPEASVARERAAEDGQSAQRRSTGVEKHDCTVSEAIQQKVTLLQESKKRKDANSERRQASAVARLVEKERKAGGKSPGLKTPVPLSSPQSGLIADREKTSRTSKFKEINPQKAARILENKWQQQAWKSPINIHGKTGQKELLKELLRDNTEQKHSAPSEESQLITREKLEQKVALLLDREFAATGRTEQRGPVPAESSRQSKNEFPGSEQVRSQGSFDDPRDQQADASAFSPAPATPKNPQALVGLRGLAARAAANEFAAPPATVSAQGVTEVDQAPAKAVSHTGAPEPTDKTVRPLSVSELAEVIAQEAKRAGINLEQFQP